MSALSEGEASISLQLGHVSVSYQGSQSYIDDGLKDLVLALLEATPEHAEQPQLANTSTGSPTPELQHMSTNTIASTTGVKSGPDLIMAAIAHIQLVKGADKATRSDIHQEMKRATTYYKSTYGGNLSSYLDSLIKNKRLNLIAEQTYALTAQERENMEQILASG